jgi:hypothetical protein
VLLVDSADHHEPSLARATTAALEECFVEPESLRLDEVDAVLKLLGAAASVARPQGARRLVEKRGHRPSVTERRPRSTGDG